MEHCPIQTATCNPHDLASSGRSIDSAARREIEACIKRAAAKTLAIEAAEYEKRIERLKRAPIPGLVAMR